MNILGISAYYHDSAACLVRDGEIVAAAQEERFTRKKHDHEFPQNAVDFCLERAGIEAGELDLVAFYDKPLLKFDRLLETYIALRPLGVQALPVWACRSGFETEAAHAHASSIAGSEGPATRAAIVFTEHHESHAASAFYPSPLRGGGDPDPGRGRRVGDGQHRPGRGNRDLRCSRRCAFPHSLGLLYSAFTYFTGFRVNSGEYKLMGLAPYGDPDLQGPDDREAARHQGRRLLPDGHVVFRVLQQGCHDLARRWIRSSAVRPRRAETDITQREMDIAASIQAVTEEIVPQDRSHFAHELTGSRRTFAWPEASRSIASANGRCFGRGPFDERLDSACCWRCGGAPWVLRSSYLAPTARQRLARPIQGRLSQSGSLLGPAFTSDEIERLPGRGGCRLRIPTTTKRS